MRSRFSIVSYAKEVTLCFISLLLCTGSFRKNVKSKMVCMEKCFQVFISNTVNDLVCQHMSAVFIYVCVYICKLTSYTRLRISHTFDRWHWSAPALYNCITVPTIQIQWTLLSSLMQWTSSQMIWDGSHFQIKCNLVSTDISNFVSFLLSCNTQIVWRERGGMG